MLTYRCFNFKVGSSFDNGDKSNLQTKMITPESFAVIDFISPSVESILTHQRIEDIVLTRTSPTSEFFREKVPNSLPALDEEKEKKNPEENQDVCREEPSECGIVEKDSFPVGESEHKVTPFFIEAELSDTDLVDQPTAKVVEQATSSVLFEENARKAVDEKPFVFQIATHDSYATGLLENQTTNKMLDVYPFSGEVSKEGCKTAQGENPADPASLPGVNYELPHFVDHIIQEKNMGSSSFVVVEEPGDSAVPVGEQHESVEMTVVKTLEPIGPLLQDTVLFTPRKEKTIALEGKENELVSLLTITKHLDSTIVDTNSKLPIEEDQSTSFQNDGSVNQQCESLRTASVECVEEKPTVPSSVVNDTIPLITEREQSIALIVEDKETGFDHLVTNKTHQNSTTRETESVTVLEESQEADHPLKQETTFEVVDDPAVSSVTCNILSTHETEEGSVETSIFVVGDVLGLLSSPLSPNEG